MGRWLIAFVLCEFILSANLSAARAESGSLLVPHNVSFIDESQAATANWGDEEEETFADAPRWTVWAGAIFLERSSPKSTTLLSSGGSEVLNAREFDFGTQAGPDINAIRHGEAFDIGFRYFQVNKMSASNSQPLFSPLDIELADPLTVSCPRIDSEYVTSIQSVELNLRRNVTDRLALLAGFRHISLRDSLSYRLDDSIFFGEFSLHLNGLNRLYGGQIGADAILWTAGRFELLSAVKAGVYGNTAHGSIDLRALGVLNSGFHTTSLNTSFVGDWNFSGVFWLNDVWAVRGGYQLLWISSVALANEQAAILSASSPVKAHADTSGDIFLHGALVSLQAGW